MLINIAAMPFCHSPWTNIDISPEGNIGPCCKFRHEHYGPALNINSASISDYVESAVLADIKNEFDHGRWPAGCERCRIEEENNIKSKRNLDFDRWENDYKEYDLVDGGFITASVAFGNTCNLKCITCNPQTSSLWSKEYAKIYGIEVKPNHFYKHGLSDELVKHSPGLIHLDVPGGEPFLSGVPEQLDMLYQWSKSGQAKHMSLHYTTNAMIYPDDRWWSLWANFKNVDIQLSIDGIEQRAEYIRYPSKWDTITENINKYISVKRSMPNLQLSVSHTVSAYNIYYLDEFFTWCYGIGLPRPWLGKVHTPASMRPSVWPLEAKKFIVDHLMTSKDADVLTWAKLIDNIDDSAHFEEFKKQTAQHDQYRGLEFDKTFPEMAKWIK